VQSVRDLAKRILPPKYVAAYRRRRLTRTYIKALGWELYERQTNLGWTEEEVEERIAARHDGFYQRMVREVLERTELVLQGLDRKIEGVNARHENELRDLREEVAALRASVDALAGPRPKPAPSLTKSDRDAPAAIAE
jgi:hypothetical protein